MLILVIFIRRIKTEQPKKSENAGPLDKTGGKAYIISLVYVCNE
jgi:hypothetical protein